MTESIGKITLIHGISSGGVLTFPSMNWWITSNYKKITMQQATSSSIVILLFHLSKQW